MADEHDETASAPQPDNETLNLLAAAEAEAAEAEALAAVARARARASRLRREAQAIAEAQAAAEAEADAEARAKAEAAGIPYIKASSLPEEDDEYVYEYIYEDDEKSEADDEAAAPTKGRLSRFRRPPPALVAKIGAVVLSASSVAASLLMIQAHDEAVVEQRRSEAFAAGARRGVTVMMSIDYRRAKDDVQRVIENSTGEFRDDFEQRIVEFTKMYQQSNVVTEGTVNATAVASMQEHTALVLVAATSRSTDSAGTKLEPRSFRLRVTVTEAGTQYKISKVEFI